VEVFEDGVGLAVSTRHFDFPFRVISAFSGERVRMAVVNSPVLIGVPPYM